MLSFIRNTRNKREVAGTVAVTVTKKENAKRLHCDHLRSLLLRYAHHQSIERTTIQLSLLQQWTREDLGPIVLQRQRHKGGFHIGDMKVWQRKRDKYDEAQIAVNTDSNEWGTQWIVVYGEGIGKEAFEGDCWSQYAYLPGAPESAMHFKRVAWAAVITHQVSESLRQEFIAAVCTLPLLKRIKERFTRTGSYNFTTI